MQDYKVIYIYGPDGSGKSTICRELVRILEKDGIKATYLWMRFNHYLSKAVNAVGHLTGLSYYITYPDGTKVGYHDYYKSRIISIAYYLTSYSDTFFSTLFKLWIPLLVIKKIIILDRFIFDMIVDLSIDTKNLDLLAHWSGKLLKRLLLPKILPIYIEVDKEVILNRRPDTKWDENFNVRLKLYKKMYKVYARGYKVKNNGQIESTLKTIIELLEKK
jgi:thymidylate kinase